VVLNICVDDTMVQRINNIVQFYRDGFQRMTLGKTLWKIIIIKLVVMFAVLKIFFFPNYLKTNFDNDRQRADHVISQLTLQGNNHRVQKEDN
jgi:hypothetical protein